MKTVIRTTCPRDCYDSCGIIVEKENDKIIRVKGDPSHPLNQGKLCGKCTIAYNGAWLDPQMRLTKPLKRIGKKGEGKFSPISWDEALNEIRDQINETLTKFGGQAIYHTHYTGANSLIAKLFPSRFFHYIGATEVDPDTICNKAGQVALESMFGTAITGFDPRTITETNCLMIWGANPSATGPHIHRNWISSCRGKVIVIDPIEHDTAKIADLHLQPFPGTDAALAYSMLHVIVQEGRLDEQFIEKHVLHWDEVAKLINECTPEWGESVTGVPKELIKEAALLYSDGPALLWMGQGLQRQRLGGNIIRACSLLPVATGNIGKLGAGFLFLNGGSTRNIDRDYLVGSHLKKGDSLSVSHMELVDDLNNSEKSKMLFCWNNNIVASNPDQMRLRQALLREDLFTVSIDVFPTDTTDYADIVLPAASFLEQNDIQIPYFNLVVSAIVKVSDPLGESLPNSEIFRRLAKKMGYDEPALLEDDETIITNVLKKAGLNIDFQELARKGTIDFTEEPVIQFADFSFPTKSGKIELKGEEDGLTEVPQPIYDNKPKNGRLRLLSPASPWTMNSSYFNDETIRKRMGEATVIIHPDEGANRKLEEGMTVSVSNENGELTLQLSLSDRVPPGVALIYKGRWLKYEESNSNVNVLIRGQKSDLGESTSLHSAEVEIKKLK